MKCIGGISRIDIGYDYGTVPGCHCAPSLSWAKAAFMGDIRGLDGACTVKLGDAPLDYVEDPESQAVRLATGRIIELSPVGHHPLSHYATRSSGSPDFIDYEVADLTFGGVSDDAVLCFTGIMVVLGSKRARWLIMNPPGVEFDVQRSIVVSGQRAGFYVEGRTCLEYVAGKEG